MSQLKIYCFSGLGADFIAFKNLRIDAELIPVDWKPVLPNESFENYCSRLTKEIDFSGPVMLMGVSFGGTVAQSIASVKKVDKCILISSIRNTKEFPLIYRIFGSLKLYKLIPEKLLNQYHPILAWSFGVSSQRQKELLKKMMGKTDTRFATWAIRQILKWKAPQQPVPALRLHGTKDHLIPFPKNDNKTIAIVDGTHLMVLNRAKEISGHINLYLKS
jgi:pimeloyl-ACP methyl ester carboxylesterase